MDDAPRWLLADACVLIDYRDSDLSLLRLVSKHVGRLHVARPVLDQVAGLSERDCTRLALEVVEVETGDLIEAARFGDDMGLEDALCLAICRDRGWTCVTNDGRLRRRCEEHGVAVRRGLRLLLDLRATTRVSVARLARAARAMQESNPFHIHDAVVAEFLDELRRIR